MMTAADVERLRAWHERASQRLHELGAHEVRYLGLDLRIPEDVFPPTPVSDLLGRVVLADVRRSDRVLDVGTGSGANALLAARTSTRVTGIAFDLVIFDPPFRWFTPRNRLEQAITDQGYRTLSRFVVEVEQHLSPAGRVLLFFRTTGDITYLQHLLDGSALYVATIASRTIITDGADATHHTYRLTRPRSNATSD